MKLWNSIFCGQKQLKILGADESGLVRIPAQLTEETAIRPAPVVLCDEIAKWTVGKVHRELNQSFCARLPFPVVLFEFHSGEFRVGVITFQTDDGLTLSVFLDAGRDVFLMGDCDVSVDDDGNVGTNWRRRIPKGIMAVHNYIEGGAGFALDCMVCVALATVTFMNCRNVTLTECSQTEKQREAFQRRRGCKPARYHVLNISSIVSRACSDASGTSLAKALHMCRGHFKTFTQERPLFGKTSGRFWWGCQARGDAKAGLVIKDYEVKP